MFCAAPLNSELKSTENCTSRIKEYTTRFCFFLPLLSLIHVMSLFLLPVFHLPLYFNKFSLDFVDSSCPQWPFFNNLFNMFILLEVQAAKRGCGIVITGSPRHPCIWDYLRIRKSILLWFMGRRGWIKLPGRIVPSNLNYSVLGFISFVVVVGFGGLFSLLLAFFPLFYFSFFFL